MLQDSIAFFNDVTTLLLKTHGALTSILLVLITILIFYWHGPLFSGPGPWGVPIFGYYPFIKKEMHIHLHELTKKYGSVYKFNVFGTTFIYMDSLEAIRECHITKSEDFPHRFDKGGFFIDAFDQGIFLVKGEGWKVWRKFFHQALREVGLNPNNDDFRNLMDESVRSMLDYLLESKGEPVDVNRLSMKEATRAVIRPYLGDTLSEEDSRALQDGYFNLVTIFTPLVNKGMLLCGTLAKKLVVPWVHGYSQMRKGVEQMSSIFYKILREHRATFSPDQQPKDFIDMFLKEKALREKKNDHTAKHFTDLGLINTLIQVYSDGALGVGLFVASYLHEFGKRRDVQDAVYEEILKVVGNERLPRLSDRLKLPYTMSAIKEMLRTLNIFPILPGLECVRDTTVQGIHVPKGSVVLLNYWAVHKDPNLYKNPEEFDATRFMPDKGQTEPSPLSFGVGKRSCAGEGIVMAELFLFLTAVIQSFILVAEEDQEESSQQSAEDKCLVRAIPRPGGRYASS